MSHGTVTSVNISTEKGIPKQSVHEITLNMQGISGDAHAGPWHRQVSLLSSEDIQIFSRQMDTSLDPGAFAENITTQGLDLGNMAVLDRIRCNDVLLEVTQIGKACHGDGCAIFREVGKCVMPKQGIFTRVIEPGILQPGATIEHIERPLRILIITLSDRAHAGHYEDGAGPKALECLTSHFKGSRWHLGLETLLVPDDATKLREPLQVAVSQGVDVVITLGSTGLGPRDIAPETVTALCHKTFSSVMEFTRIKYGNENPSALISRGIAGVAQQTLIYTLPGSVRAVEQYLGEILKTLEHAIGMVHGLDWH
ncbi:MAG: molybdenum cofactor synthesis protein [Planctomycetes bacterium]|nr:molybdenum cofactor synthesis protein [Planctomycetota bacterium]